MKIIKTITVGDLHGRTYWEDINPNDYGYIVFVGDYTDSFHLSNLEIKINLKKLIDFKRKYPDKVILLLGNHDLAYYWYISTSGTSGFKIEALADLYELFRIESDKDFFQAAFQIENCIWTHAGIHHLWYEKYVPDMIEKYNIKGNLAEILNILFESNYKPLYYNAVGIRGGTAPEAGPFWLHLTDAYNNVLNGYHHIFGHTYRDEIVHHTLNKDTSLTCIDTGNRKEFYELEIEIDI